MKEILITGHTITLHNVSPALIEDCIHEDEHLVHWSSTHVETVYKPADVNKAMKVGLQYISRQKIGKKIIDIPCEIAEYIENKCVTVTSYTKEGISHSRYIMEQNGEEIHLTLEGSYIPRNWFQKIKIKLSLPFAKLFLKDELERLEDYIYNYIHHEEEDNQ